MSSIYKVVICLLGLILVADFLILFFADTELPQMRRILLAGCILLLDVVVVFMIAYQAFRLSFSAAIQNKHNRILLLSSLIATLLAATVFQSKLPDAYRHAYASAFIAYFLNEGVAKSLGNMVELVTSYKKDNHFSSAMDQCNNRSGRATALGLKAKGKSWRNVELAIDKAYKEKSLIIRKSQHADIIACYERHFPEEKQLLASLSKARD